MRTPALWTHSTRSRPGSLKTWRLGKTRWLDSTCTHVNSITHACMHLYMRTHFTLRHDYARARVLKELDMDENACVVSVCRYKRTRVDIHVHLHTRVHSGILTHIYAPTDKGVWPPNLTVSYWYEDDYMSQRRRGWGCHHMCVDVCLCVCLRVSGFISRTYPSICVAREGMIKYKKLYTNLKVLSSSTTRTFCQYHPHQHQRCQADLEERLRPYTPRPNWEQIYSSGKALELRKQFSGHACM